jgi:transcription termination factor NusB
MKVAVIEMLFEKTDIPVIINEYVEITKEFVGNNVAGFVNALLDKISSQIKRKCKTET